MLVSREELKRRQGFNLWHKRQWAIFRYIDYVEVYHETGVYQGFSGGKDSQTLDDLIRRLHAGELNEYLEREYILLYKMYIEGKPPPPKVFCDTGLEFDEIRAHVKTFTDVTWLKPKMLWTDVVTNIGFLIGSKKQSRMIHTVSNPTENNEASRNLYLTGIKQNGEKSKDFKIAKRWLPLLKAPFKVSHKCCDIFKKEPFHRYEAKTGRKPISGTTAEESGLRRATYLKYGCNSFGDDPMSRPLSIWTKSDIWQNAKELGIRFCEIYYEREVDFIEDDGQIVKIMVDGEEQTGCMYCLVGPPKDIEKRWDRMRITHNKKWRFMMDSPKVKIRQVLEFIGINSKLF